jgi:hypothetical protein
MQLSTRFILLAIKQITFKIYRVVVLFGTGVRSDEILSATLIDMPDLCIHFHRTIMSYHHAPPSPSYGNRHIVTILLCIAKRISFHVESTNQQIVGTDTWRWSLLLNWNSFAHLFLYMHNLFVIIPSVASPSYYVIIFRRSVDGISFSNEYGIFPHLLLLLPCRSIMNDYCVCHV